MTPLEADAAYTAAVETAARTGDWGVVAAAHQATHQTRDTGTQAVAERASDDHAH